MVLLVLVQSSLSLSSVGSTAKAMTFPGLCLIPQVESF